MARLALTVVGGIIGSFFGMPQLGMMVGGMIGSQLFGPTIKGPRLNDLTVTASTYGNAIPMLFGTSRMAGNMIWSIPIKESKKKSGGKGGPKQVTYSYSCSFAMAFCEGTADSVLRIWADGKLIYGATPISTSLFEEGADFDDIVQLWATIGEAKKKKKIKFRFYKGDEIQEPDPIIVADKGEGNTPAYRGLVYIVFDDMPLEDFGNRIPQITAEITKLSETNLGKLHCKTEPAPDPVFAGGYGLWFPDWPNGRLVRVANDGSMDHFEIGTMNRVNAHPADPALARVPNKPGFTPGGRFFYDQIGAGNSRPIVQYDINTFEKTNQWGADVNSFHEWPIQSGVQQWHFQGTVGSIGGFQVLTQTGPEDYFIHINTRDGWSILHANGKWVASGNDIDGNAISPWSLFAPSPYPLIGEQRVNQTDIYFWQNYFGTLRFFQWTVTAGDFGDIECDEFGANCVAVPAKNMAPAALSILGLPYTVFDASTVQYDPTDGNIFVVGVGDGNNVAFKYSFTTQEFKFIREYTETSFRLPPLMRYSQLAGDKFAWVGHTADTHPGRYMTIDLQNGDLFIREEVISVGFENAQMFSDDISETVCGQDNYVTTYYRLVMQEGGLTITLPQICQAILERTRSLSAEEIDVSLCDPIPVKGYVISRDSSARDCLNQLASAYFFDGVESDFKIKVVSRGNGATLSLTQDDLGLVQGKDVSFKETIGQELELPMRVTYNYYDSERDYNIGSQFAKRNNDPYPTMYAKAEEKNELPIVLDATEAKQMADKWMKSTWAQRTGSQYVLPWQYAASDPTDTMTITMNSGTVHYVRLTNFDIGADYSIQVRAVSEKASAYVSTVIGDPGSGVLPEAAGDPLPAKPYVINTPLLRDVDDTQGIASVYYITAGPVIGKFEGAMIYTSLNNTDFDMLTYISGDSETGKCYTALPNTTSWGAVDTTTELRVVMDDYNTTLESVTYAELLSGKNAALIGDEIIQYQYAILQDDGSYLLSNILRARRGTNYAVNGHTTYETFVVLDLANGDISKEQRGPSEFVSTRKFKAVPPGTLIEDATPVSKNLEPNDLKPYTPEGFEITDDGTDITVSWLRRSRITDELTSLASQLHYREGQGTTASMKWRAFYGATLADEPWLGTEDGSGSILMYDAGVPGGYKDPELTLLVADVTATANDTFVLEVYEVGFVDGFKKYIQFERVAADNWNTTELY